VSRYAIAGRPKTSKRAALKVIPATQDRLLPDDRVSTRRGHSGGNVELPISAFVHRNPCHHNPTAFGAARKAFMKLAKKFGFGDPLPVSISRQLALPPRQYPCAKTAGRFGLNSPEAASSDFVGRFVATVLRRMQGGPAGLR
jgi:hypothetical protein